MSSPEIELSDEQLFSAWKNRSLSERQAAHLLKTIPHTAIGEFLKDDQGALGTVMAIVGAE